MDSTYTLRHFPHPFLFRFHCQNHRLLHQLSSPEPRVFTALSCFKPRRRPRRKNKLNKLRPTDFQTHSPIDTSSLDSKLQTVIELDQLTAEASSRFYSFYYSSRSQLQHFLSSGLDAFHDLQTLIDFDGQNRLLIVSCRRSTVEFIGQLVLLSFVVVFVLRGLLAAGSRFRKQFKFDHNPVVRRDRSLGGREVVVARTGVGVAREKATVRKNDFLGLLDSPLSMAPTTVNDVSEEVLTKGGWVEEKLPKWWPLAVPRQIVTVNRQDYQIEANRLVRALVDSRMSGRDFMEDEIIRLRQICRLSGVKVSFSTTNMRDSFYRAAVDLVLNNYSRAPISSELVLLNDEDGRNFVAGLAEDIGIEDVRAARIVSASVAARMRSCFLQAWALVMQGRHSEANAELLKICHVLQIFPPEESSPEIEMLTLGLKKHLKKEQRESLMNMFSGVCGKDSHRTAAEALGLVLPPKGVGN